LIPEVSSVLRVMLRNLAPSSVGTSNPRETTMATLRLIRAEAIPPEDDGGSWGELVAWFSELVIRFDRGDISGVAEAQAEMERFGFFVTYRRRPRRGKGVAR
jgi:hypothetical protein